MNRADMLRALVAHRAAADALTAALRMPIEAAYEQEGVAEGVRVPGVGDVRVALTSSDTVVTDMDALLDWVQSRYPTEVVTESVVVRRARSNRWLTNLVQALDPVDPEEVGPGGATQCMDGDGTIIPGVVWRRGGQLKSIGVHPDAALKARYTAAAVDYVTHGLPMPAINGGILAVTAAAQEEVST